MSDSKEIIQEIEKSPPEPISKQKASEFLQKIWDSSIVNGPIICVVIRIDLDSFQESYIFFANGRIIMSEIPIIGYDIEANPDYRFNLLVTKELIMQIPFLGKMVEQDYISKRGTPEELSDPQSYNKSCYFIFRSPEMGIVNYENSIGTHIVDSFVSELFKDPTANIMSDIE